MHRRKARAYRPEMQSGRYSRTANHRSLRRSGLLPLACQAPSDPHCRAVPNRAGIVQVFIEQRMWQHVPLHMQLPGLDASQLRYRQPRSGRGRRTRAPDLTRRPHSLGPPAMTPPRSARSASGRQVCHMDQPVQVWRPAIVRRQPAVKDLPSPDRSATEVRDQPAIQVDLGQGVVLPGAARGENLQIVLNRFPGLVDGS